MTLEEVKAMKEDFISASVAASVLRMDTGRLVGYAKNGQLPFPVVISGNWIKIPRIPFLKQYGAYEDEKEEANKADQILKELHGLNVALGGTNLILMSLLRHLSPEGFDEVDRIFKTMEGKKQ